MIFLKNLFIYTEQGYTGQGYTEQGYQQRRMSSFRPNVIFDVRANLMDLIPACLVEEIIGYLHEKRITCSVDMKRRYGFSDRTSHMTIGSWVRARKAIERATAQKILLTAVLCPYTDEQRADFDEQLTSGTMVTYSAHLLPWRPQNASPLSSIGTA
jgi:hypothetical protein